LRTPLNAVVGMANLLLMEDPRPEQKENLEILRFAAENQMSIINDILDFNQIDTGNVKLDMQDFQLDLLLQNTYGAFKHQADAKMIGLDCTVDQGLKNLVLSGDDSRLTQILFNLLGNAVKFTAKGSVILEVKIIERKQETLKVLFTVKDTGIGIALDLQATIFDPYIRHNTRTNRQYHGTGLGLTIASRLTALMGSTLNLSSKEGQGTTFSFELAYPIAGKATAVPEYEVKSLTDAAGKLRVLVAEDNQVNILVIRKLLNIWNIQPHIVENGKEAVEAVASGDYDVILMDINMPVMDGFEASKKIRELEDPKKAGIHIIALTASVGKTIENHEGYKYLNDCVLKPFKPEHLKEKLDRLSLLIS